ncbi:MAG: DUF4276 family protein [Deltaproteobacteria bacterium]|nr:DUF4276 family protein [Deltaproteobacteria bacterium]
MSRISWVDFFVEERSAEAALEILVPRIRADFDFQIHSYEGVGDMLAKLPGRLKGIASYIQPDHRVVVVRDEDRKDCTKLKSEIEKIAIDAGLRPKAKRGRFDVLTRIAIEELEAWWFGDTAALVAAFPGVPKTLATRQAFRDADRIKGGTWEALERLLREAGHARGGLAKTAVARTMAARVDLEKNTSRSFQAFRSGLLSL